MMLRTFIILMGHLLFGQYGFADSPLPFFRNIDSVFPSGSAFFQELTMNQNTLQSKLWLDVEIDDQKGWVDANNVVRPIEFYRYVVNRDFAQLRTQPQHWLSAFLELPPTTRFELVKLNGWWAQVRTEIMGRKHLGWTDIENLVPIREGKKNVIAFHPLPIRSAPNKNSVIVGKAQAKSRMLELNRTETNWVLINLDGLIGYVPLEEVWSYDDLSDNEVLPVHGEIRFRRDIRKQEVLITRSNRKMSVTASFLEIWRQSYIRDHGLVWWKQDPENSQAKMAFEDVLKRDIHAYAIDPQNPLRSIVSAKGIFLTLNGRNFEKLEKFGNEDLPLAIAPDGVLIVGQWLSQDNGKTFSRFVRWDYLTQAVQNRLGQSIQHIRLSQVKILDPLKPVIELQLDTGAAGKIKVESRLPSPAWAYIGKVL